MRPKSCATKSAREEAFLDTLALPRLKAKFDVPADRITLPYGWSLPDRLWHMGDQEVPGEEGQMRFGWRLAFFLGLLFCETPSLIDAALWETRRHETTGHPLLGSEENSVLRTIARYGGEASITASATFGRSASPDNVVCWHTMTLQ